jgi:hypothetical protein
MTNPEIRVRAYDLGGFGDIAGAMRVASYLQKLGIPTDIQAKSASALAKLGLLQPDVRFSLNGSNQGTVLIDVAGHYKDSRVDENHDVPHHYSEDMDNPQDRRKIVPIYMKSGLKTAERVPVRFNLGMENPMFYRPYREWELPKPGIRDLRKLIFETLTGKNPGESVFSSIKKYFSRESLRLEHVLDEIDHIGFAHLSPQISQYPDVLLDHPYFSTVHKAHLNSSGTYGIGMFVPANLEEFISIFAHNRYWNVIRSSGLFMKFNKDLPTIIFLGPQQQMTTSSLFVSSDIPNLVTGDLSLSDAIYSLIAMDGKGFFYESPSWKLPTLYEMARIFNEHASNLGFVNAAGGNFINYHDPLVKDLVENDLVDIMTSKTHQELFTGLMREAFRTEIRRRFGDVPVSSQENPDGLYIPAGAPYLFQDATANVVNRLRNDPESLRDVEQTRKAIINGEPVSINVHSGVLEPSPKTSPKPSKKESKDEYDELFNSTSENILDDYFGHKKYGLEQYINNNDLDHDLYNIIPGYKKDKELENNLYKKPSYLSNIGYKENISKKYSDSLY